MCYVYVVCVVTLDVDRKFNFSPFLGKRDMGDSELQNLDFKGKFERVELHLINVIAFL